MPFSDLPGGDVEDLAGKWFSGDCGSGLCPLRSRRIHSSKASGNGQGFVVLESDGRRMKI